MRKKLAIISTHPIQYNVPLFQLLHLNENIQIKVFYTWGNEVMKNKFDPGFNKYIEWDLPLLNGYEYEFCKNTAKVKGSHHFQGINNPYLIEMINEYKPDALLLFGWCFKSHLQLMRKLKGKMPILFRGDSTMLDESGFFKNKIRFLFLKWVYKHVDIALFTGKNNCDYFIAAGLKEHQLVFAPHAVDNSRFGNLSASMIKIATDYKSNLGIKADDFVFLFAGKFESKKDILLLVESFKNADLESHIHLVLTGTGVLENEIVCAINKNKISNIHLTGFVNQQNMPAVYEMADVFIIPSKGPGETWGLSVNEAMANGKAVIVSNKCGCAPDLIHENGFVFESGNSADLTAKIKWISSENCDVKKMKSNSQNIIESYSINKLASIIESTVLNLWAS